MINRKIYETLSAFALAGTFSGSLPNNYYEELTPEERGCLEKRIAEKRLQVLKKKGIKEWDIEGVTIYALNKRNAERKYNNIMKQLKFITDKNK